MLILMGNFIRVAEAWLGGKDSECVLSTWSFYLNFGRCHPHIGTDKLPRVIENMRNRILECGGEVHFQTKMISLILERDKVIGGSSC